MNIIAYIKNHPYIHTHDGIDRELGWPFYYNFASKGPIVVTKFDANIRYQNLLLFNPNSQSHTIRLPLLPSMNQKPCHKGN
jgi:hypothetical protein